jgi:hypothetical protein
MRKIMIALAVLCAAAGNAYADELGIYTADSAGYRNASGGGAEGSDVFVGGSAAVGDLGAGFRGQIDASYDNISASGTHGDAWNTGGDVYWHDAKGSIGLSYNYSSLSGSLWPSSNFQSYGAFGEWYFARDLTLRGMAGAFRFGNGDNGSYGELGIGWYPIRALVINLDGGLVGFHSNREWVANISGEYMLSDLPLGLKASYGEEGGGFGGTSTIFMVAITLHTGDIGKYSDLEPYQRRGAAEWTGAIGPTSLL